MSLEEEVEKECFFTKFGRVSRKLAFPLIATVALTTATCSKKKKTPFEPENQPPETTIVSGPSGIVNTDTVTFKWKGEDEDGSVERFRYFLVKSDTLLIEEKYTTETEKKFIELDEGNYKFGVSAIDDNLVMDMSPATKSFIVDIQDSIPQPKQEVVLNTSTTNEQGRTYFVDNQTQESVPVQVRDAKTKYPINSVSVEYLDGEDFKTYLVDPDKNYLPAVFVYPHNSEKILDLGEIVLKAFINQVIQGEEEHKALYSWESEVTNNWANYYYVKTISKDEVLKLKEVEYAAFDLAAEIATLKINYNPIPEDYSLSDLIKFLDAQKYFKNGVVAERWDIYHIDWGRKLYNGKVIKFGADNFDMIPSNIPTLTLNEPKVEGNKMTITWKGSDKTTYNLNYFYESQGFPQKDLTITQGSDPNKPDLTYYYKILKDGYKYIDWKSTTATDLGLSDLADADYTIFVQVSDEVENYSDIEIASFSTKKINTKNFNIFDYMILTKDSYWDYTNDYYSKIIDRGVYNGKTLATVENPNSGELYWISSSGIYLMGVNVGHDYGYNIFFNPPAKIGSSNNNINDDFNTNFNIYSDLDYTSKVGYGQIDWRCLRYETVTVPAGTFKDCVLVSEYDSITLNNSSSVGNCYHWLAKGVGEIKFRDNSGKEYELESYSVK